MVTAFGARISTEHGGGPGSIVVGSIFDGVIFTMKGDRVAEILVGAASE